tara:strand:- start:72 stop:359 length:288 start_codon:yes stop_codon:yes gene_type:complete
MSLGDIKDGWLNYLMSGMLQTRKPTPALQNYLDERFQACMTCPYMKEKTFFNKNRKWRSCSKCGCAFPAMIFAYGKRCPDGRWDVIPKAIRQKKE